MNILHVTGMNYPTKFGGFERWLSGIGSFSSNYGSKVYISYSMVHQSALPILHLMESYGVSLIFLNSDAAIESFCSENHIDIVHFHFGFEGFKPLYRNLKVKGITLYCHLHCENYYFTNREWKNSLLSFIKISGHRIKTFFTAKYFAQFFAVSHAVLNQYHTMYFWSKNKISILHLGLPDYSRTNWPENSTPVICCTAFHNPIKGVDVLLSALSILKAEHIPFHCLQIGGGEDTSMLKKHCNDLGLDEYVTWVGLTNDVYHYLSASDIYCQPSRTEALSLSIAEAMQMHLPVVASNVGGIPELIHDNKNGFLVPCDDPEALAEKLKILLLDQNLRTQMGLASQQILSELGFSHTTSIAKLFKHYESSRQAR